MLFGYIKDSVFHYTTIGSWSPEAEITVLENAVEVIKNRNGYERIGLRTIDFLINLGTYYHLPKLVSLAEAEANPFEEGQGVETLEVGSYTKAIYNSLCLKGELALVWIGEWFVFDKSTLTPIDNFSTPYELYERNKWYYSKPRMIRTIEEYNDWVNFLMQAQDDGCYFRGHGFPPSGREVIMDEVNQLGEYNVEQWLPMLVISDFDTEPCYDDELDVVKTTIVSKHFF